MAKQTETAPTTGTNGPTHRLYHIDSSGEKNIWTDVAVGWLNQDGSINLKSRSGAVLLPGQSYQIRVIDKTE
jgi:hypothetical protein